MRSRRHQSLDLAWASLRHAQGRMLGLPFIATAIAPGLLFGWPVCIAALTVASVASFLIYMPLTALALNSGASLTEDGPLHGVGPATFLFATEDGTISGWNKAAGGESVIAVNESANPADGE